MRKAWRWIAVLALMAGGLASCGGSEGERLLEERCTSCHEKAVVVAKDRTRGDWTQKVSEMIVYGAELSAEEKEVLIDYLAKNYGPE